MELNHLRYFFEVAKAGSFTEAARRLRISQSALSKAVALLEDHEGIKLFERSKKGVTLTALGTEVFMRSERIFQMVSEIETTCKGMEEKCEGPLRFGASDHVTNYLLVEKVHRMRREHPKVVPSLFSGTPNDIVALIMHKEIEFGLFFTKVNVPGVRFEPLLSLDMAVVCHPDLLPADPEDLSPARLRTLLQKLGLIGSIRAQYQHHPSQELMNLLGKDPEVAFESNSQETQKRLCLAGGGVAYLARFMVERELKDGTLVEIPLKKPISLQLHLATRKGRELPLTARTFLQILSEKSGK